MSLLTDKKILAALNEAWGNDGEDTINDVECGDRAIADASQTVTLKAVAEWVVGLCDKPFHHGVGGQRFLCSNCMGGFVGATSNGRLPGENTNMAVLDTEE